MAYFTGGTSGPGVDSISCQGGEDFLGKCISLDTFSWQMDFPVTLIPKHFLGYSSITLQDNFFTHS